MSSIDNFLSEIYSEELYSINEREYDEVMAAPALDEDWTSYEEWSDSLPFTEGDVENFEIINGKVHHKPQPPERERIGGIDV